MSIADDLNRDAVRQLKTCQVLSEEFTISDDLATSLLFEVDHDVMAAAA